MSRLAELAGYTPATLRNRVAMRIEREPMLPAHVARRNNVARKRPMVTRAELLSLITTHKLDYDKVGEILRIKPSTVKYYLHIHGISIRSLQRDLGIVKKDAQPVPHQPMTGLPMRNKVIRYLNERRDGEVKEIDFSEAAIGKFGTRFTNHVYHGRKLTLEDI